MFISEAHQSLCPPEEGEAHVWVVVVSEVLPLIPFFTQFLSRQEREVAGRFTRPTDCERHVVAHGILRILLGRYLEADPERIEFETNAFGKPGLVSVGNLLPLSFNLAHSGDVVVYAVTLRRKIGIDVEKIRPDINAMELALSQFADEEINNLRACTPVERPNAFFRCWTRKEAYVKARGQGLSIPLNKFAVTVSLAEPVQVSRSEDDPGCRENWSMFDLYPYSGYAAAIVVEGKVIRVVSRRWTSSE